MVNPNGAALPKDPAQEEWTLAPAEPELGRQLWQVGRVFATGALGGVLSLAAFGVFVAPATIETRGATRGYRLQRERQELCLKLGVTPAELAALEARGELDAALAELAE